MFSNEQVNYFKEYILLKNSGDDVGRISSSLFDSKISLNPHQISAAMAFFRNPKKRGMIFADEVGLGKTIEAGLVISQYWYEQKRKILIICPASLIKQWNEELMDKFHLESVVLDGKLIRDNQFTWETKIYLSSINTVYMNKEKFGTKFDLIVIDEAHKLRNVYKDKGVMAPAVKEVFSGQKKLLLTATPFQNNLMELFGLMSLIDEEIFPDLNVFKQKYIHDYAEYKDELHSIVSNYAVRTLRKDVVKYINYTKRNVLLANYELSEKERIIYNKIENLIYSEDIFQLYGTAQVHLIILLLQKLISSSMYAVRSTLFNMVSRISEGKGFELSLDDEEDSFEISISENDGTKFSNDIRECINSIDSLEKDSKLERLKQSISDLYVQFETDTSRNKRILIFTESKKTQEYLYQELSKTYARILLFNGVNTGEEINDIYNKWCIKNNPDKKIAKSIAIRRAIVDAFENDYEILIATDAAAEGLNLQFCSVLINYDLPWNPQKIEQRIGRCHRYGQKNDVIVINLLNNSSNIDKRIYELLNGKLGIFEETFGSSDKILGTTSISENIEDAIRRIYKSCRNPQEIEDKFAELQNEFKEEIEDAIRASESDLDTYFDEEVAMAFDFQYIEATRIVDEMADLFYKIIKETFKEAEFFDEQYIFVLDGIKRTVLAKYDTHAEFCSISSEFGQNVLNQIIKVNNSSCVGLTLDYGNSGHKIGYLDGITQKKANLVVSKIIYESFEINEALVISGIFEDGTVIPEDVCHKLLKLPCVRRDSNLYSIDSNILDIHQQDIDERISTISNYNASVFQEELQYIDNWADSMIEKVQLSVKKMREERKELQMSCDFTNSVDEKTRIQEEIYKLSKKINKSWIELAQLEDEIEERRYSLINNLKSEKDKSVSVEKLFEMELEIV